MRDIVVAVAASAHALFVAESFLQLLNRERIRLRIYTTRVEARQDIFDYVEVFCNPKRRHSVGNDLAPFEYEKQYFQRLSRV